MGAFYFHHGVAVDDDIPKPGNISLGQNYPNPFNASTIIEFSLGEPSDVTIDIYDLLGRAVAMLELGRMSPAATSYPGTPAITPRAYISTGSGSMVIQKPGGWFC